MPQRVPVTVHLWISRLAGLAGAVAILLGGYTGFTGERIVRAAASTWVLVAIAAFLVAIWAVLYEIRNYGVKQR